MIAEPFNWWLRNRETTLFVVPYRPSNWTTVIIRISQPFFDIMRWVEQHNQMSIAPHFKPRTQFPSNRIVKIYFSRYSILSVAPVLNWWSTNTFRPILHILHLSVFVVQKYLQESKNDRNESISWAKLTFFCFHELEILGFNSTDSGNSRGF